MNKEKKTIKCLFLGDFQQLISRIEKRYTVIETDNPDYVFLSDASLKYAYKYDCVRIIFLGENIRPDFNLVDYAAGFDEMVYGDRYLYYPLFVTDRWRNYLDDALNLHDVPISKSQIPNKFCAMVVSNVRDASDERVSFFNELSKYKTVDSGGKSLNNLPGKRAVKDKIDFLKNYKFSLAFENSSYPGYLTEKITQAWAGGTIPVYWGDPNVSRIFNENAFINCHSYGGWNEVVDRIVEIDNNDDLFLSMRNEKIIKSDFDINSITDSGYLDAWLDNIFLQPLERAIRRTNSKVGWGAYYERDAKDFTQMQESKSVQLLYRIVKKIHKWK